MFELERSCMAVVASSRAACSVRRAQPCVGNTQADHMWDEHEARLKEVCACIKGCGKERDMKIK